MYNCECTWSRANASTRSRHNLGPLWAHSVALKSTNGDLLKYFHGSNGIKNKYNYIILAHNNAFIHDEYYD